MIGLNPSKGARLSVGKDAGLPYNKERSRKQEGAMIDSFTKKPIRVSDDGDAGPYILVQLDQLDMVKKLLDDSDIRYAVDEDAISFNGQPYTAVVNLGHHVDVLAVQKLLDENADPKMARHRRPHSGRRG